MISLKQFLSYWNHSRFVSLTAIRALHGLPNVVGGAAQSAGLLFEV